MRALELTGEIVEPESKGTSHDELLEQLNFLGEIDRLKSVLRQSPVVNLDRKENTAEHSWHVAMYAVIFSRYASAGVQIDRVIEMLLVHDIVEIEAGDTPIHQARPAENDQSEREARAAESLFGLLPALQCQKFLALWQEFELGQSEDARFAKAMDRLQPLIQNVNLSGGTWRDSDVTHDQVLSRYGPTIESGSSDLWSMARELVDGHFATTNNSEG